MKQKKLNKLFYVFIISLRLATAVSILFFPLEGILIALILDVLDSWFFAASDLPQISYHDIDKPIDYLTYVIELIVAAQTTIFPVLFLLFIFRSIGHLLFRITGKDKVFVFFPNLYEYLLLAYLVIQKFSLHINVLDWRLILGLLIFKVAQEVYVHFFPLNTAYRLTPVLREKLTV